VTHKTYGAVAREVARLNPQHLLMWSGIDCAEIDLPTCQAICNQCGLGVDSGCVVTVPREGWVVLVQRRHATKR
jgi:hypothetical protein